LTLAGYRDKPIALRIGETTRVYLLNVVEHDSVVSFHLHANFFDLHARSFAHAPPRAIVSLTQAERAILEFSFRESGVSCFTH
jgi:manganese oxidase